MADRTIRLNVTHRAATPLHLTTGVAQRCSYCGELLWTGAGQGAAFQIGGCVTVTLRQDASGAVAEWRGFAGGDSDPIHSFCYEGWQDKAGHVLLPRGEREQACQTCREGHLPALLDDDGVIFGVSGTLGTWAHANGDGWWPCKGVGGTTRPLRELDFGREVRGRVNHLVEAVMAPAGGARIIGRTDGQLDAALGVAGLRSAALCALVQAGYGERPLYGEPKAGKAADVKVSVECGTAQGGLRSDEAGIAAELLEGLRAAVGTGEVRHHLPIELIVAPFFDGGALGADGPVCAYYTGDTSGRVRAWAVARVTREGR